MTDTPGTAPQSIYPLPTTADTDPRFTFNLLFDVGDVLHRHGYPHPGTGAEWVQLLAALGRFLYQTPETR
jgi:hypothetical protein